MGRKGRETKGSEEVVNDVQVRELREGKGREGQTCSL